MVSAHGMPAATSCAKEGPDNTPTGMLSPSSLATISCGSRPVLSSKPLHSQTRLGIGLSFSMCAVGPSPATGVATMRSAGVASEAATWAMASSRSRLMRKLSGKVKPGKNRVFSRWSIKGRISDSKRPHNITSLRGARAIAMAVPQAPAPRMLMFIVCYAPQTSETCT